MADPGVGSWNPINIFAMLRSLINNGCPIVTFAGTPTSGASGTFNGVAGIGTVLIDYTNGVMYQNTGTLASPTWTQTSLGALSVGTTQLAAAGVTSAKIAPSIIQTASGSISPANIIGTAAGQLGHAAGVILVPAAPALAINELISCVVAYDFLTAAYTAGGNLTVNIGAGAALTGLISNANFIQSGADKIVEFVPLAAVPNVYTTANSLNLVSSVAPTNPGTAAGVFNWFIAYRQIPALLD